VSEDDESSFLGRWARRKAQARQEALAPDARPPDAQAGAGAGEDQDAKTEAEPFDLASLPSLESIDATTDVSAFLRREVPDWLRNAALKKAWAADPAIRDYVNPAMEYAYDWNAPGGVPGAGALEAGHDALRQAMDMLTQTPQEGSETAHTLVGRSSAVASNDEEDQSLPAPPPASENVRRSETESAAIMVVSDLKTESCETTPTVADGKPSQDAAAPAPPRRRHGGATPV